MKNISHKRLVLLTFALLLLGLPCVLCFVWVGKEHRQHALDQQLIAALKKSNTKQAIVLVEAGADPNTRYELTPTPFLLFLINHLLHPSPAVNRKKALAYHAVKR